MIPAGLERVLDLGFGVFPCRTRTLDDAHKVKAPLTKHGKDDATGDVKLIEDWAQRFPQCAWGARPPAEINILDIDTKDSDGFATLSGLEQAHGVLPATMTSRTASGGQHRLFRTSTAYKNRAGVRPGLDVRSHSGYIICPPSVIETGAYAWIDPASPVAPAPDWLVEQVFAFEERKPSASGKVPEGARNDTLFRFAASLRARNLDKTEAWSALQARNLDCAPPLTDKELEQILESAWRYPAGFALTDLGNRDRFAALRGEDFRYLVGGGWHIWTGQRFEADHERRVIVVMGEVARGIYIEAGEAADPDRRKTLATWAKASESRNRIEAAVALAQSDPKVVDRYEAFDADAMLVGMQNGVFDLGRMEFRPARRDDRITRQVAVAYDANARAPRWQQFQTEIHNGDTAMVAFKQRAWGYTLSGDTSEQVFFVPWGDGENGKGTEQETIAAIMGDYALAIEPETLMKKTHGGANAASSDIAEMRGARFVYTAELEDGQELAEKLMKRLTGQDTIRARFLYRERFSFRPVAKFWISTNHRPEIHGTDHAIWRRVVLIPYTVRFSGDRKDPALRAKLAAEASGIFNWLVEGFRLWRQEGLALPAQVHAAVVAYRTAQDQLGAFLEECTKAEREKTSKAADVYRRYVAWAHANGIRPPTRMVAAKFHEQMERHQWVRVKHDTQMYPGLAILPWSRDDEV